MRDDEDALAEIDLSAWEPPVPPASLVDDVIARVAAMPALVEPAPPPPASASRAKRWWIAGGVAAAAAAVAAFALWGVERAPVRVTADPHAELQRLTAELERVQHEVDRSLAGGPSPAVERAKQAVRERLDKQPAASCDEVACVLTNYEGACCAKFRKPSPPVADSLDRKTIDKALDAIEPQVQACGAGFTGTMKLGAMVSPSGEVTDTRVTGPDGADKPADVAACMYGAALNLTFPKTRKGGSFTYPFVLGAKAACNAELLVEKGNALANAGFWDKALVRFEDALACAPSETTTKRAFAAACHAKLAGKAKLYYGKLPASARTQLAPLCERNGITLAACDAKPFVERGTELLQTGMDAAALAQLQAALACSSTPETRRLAFVAACRAKDAAVARKLYATLTGTPSAIAAVCTRNGIALDGAGR